MEKYRALVKYSFSWPHDYMFTLNLKVMGEGLNITIYWNYKYGFLDAIYLRHNNESLILILCGSNVKNPPAKVKTYNPTLDTILAAILSALVVLISKYCFSISMSEKSNLFRFISILSFAVSTFFGLLLGYSSINLTVIHFYIVLYYSLIALTVIATFITPLGFGDRKGENRGFIIFIIVFFLFALSFGISAFYFDYMKSGAMINVILILLLSLTYVILLIIALRMLKKSGA